VAMYGVAGPGAKGRGLFGELAVPPVQIGRDDLDQTPIRVPEVPAERFHARRNGSLPTMGVALRCTSMDSPSTREGTKTSHLIVALRLRAHPDFSNARGRRYLAGSAPQARSSVSLSSISRSNTRKGGVRSRPGRLRCVCQFSLSNRAGDALKTSATSSSPFPVTPASATWPSDLSTRVPASAIAFSPPRPGRASNLAIDRACSRPMHVRSVAGEERVTPLELFFDLAFAFAITQVTGFLAANETGEGLLRGALLLAAPRSATTLIERKHLRLRRRLVASG
jgi:hypothetical protein